MIKPNKNNFILSNSSLLVVTYLILVLFKILLSFFIKAPYIFQDESVYFKLAQSFFETHKFMYRGSFFNIPDILYMILISPAFLSHSNTVAYATVKIINSFLFNLVLFPTYLLAKEFLNRRIALLIAVISAVIPSSLYINTVLPENLYYPLFILSVYFSYKSITEEKILFILLTGGSFGLLYLTKPHALMLILAYILTLFVFAFITKNEIKKTVAYILRNSTLAFIPFVLIITIKMIIVNKSINISSFLGDYEYAVPNLNHIAFLSFTNLFTMNLFSLSFSTMFVPFIFTLAYVITLSPKNNQDNKDLFLKILLTVTTFILIAVTTRHTLLFDTSNRLHLRYYFMITPLFLIAFYRYILISNSFENGFSLLETVSLVLGVLFVIYCLVEIKLYIWSALANDNLSLAWLNIVQSNYTAIYIIFGLLSGTGLIFYYIIIKKQYLLSLVIILNFTLLNMSASFLYQERVAYNEIPLKNMAVLYNSLLSKNQDAIIVGDGISIPQVYMQEFFIRNPVHVAFIKGAFGKNYRNINIDSSHLWLQGSNIRSALLSIKSDLLEVKQNAIISRDGISIYKYDCNIQLIPPTLIK